jgi:HEAT repeat protein
MGIFSKKPNIKRLQKKCDIEGLIKALEHSDYSVRQKAAKALGRMDDSRAVPPLLKLLDKWKHLHIYNADIVRALGEIGSSTAVNTLIDALQHSKDHFVRAAAAEALGKIGDRRAVRPLIDTLRSTSIKIDDITVNPLIDPTFLYRVHTDVFGYTDVSGTEAIFKVLIRQKAAEALGKIGDPQAIEALNEALEDKTLVKDDPIVHKAAKEALEKIQKKQK